MTELRKILENAGVDFKPANLQNFIDLGEAQRGDPEMAMRKAQDVLGGGVMSVVVEHIGDLTHRMTHMLKWDHNDPMNSGYEYVNDKVGKILSYLEHGYGFEREHLENMEANARYHDKDLEEHKANVERVLYAYAEEHSKLPVYNQAQKYARNAAVGIGAGKYEASTILLKRLKQHLNSPKQWHKFATENLDGNGMAESKGDDITGAMAGFGEGADRGSVQRATQYIQQDRFAEGWRILQPMVQPDKVATVEKWAKSLPNNFSSASSSKIINDPKWQAWFETVWTSIKPLLK